MIPSRAFIGGSALCDGTHKISESEAVGKLYWYDGAGKRHLAADGEGYYIRSDRQPQAA